MAFGDNPADGSLRDAWYAFCDQIKEAGDHVFKDDSGANDSERTYAFRYLTQNLSQAFDIWLENRDPRNPNLHAFCGPTRKLGADNADCIYLQSWINDRDTYKISGNRGTAKMFNITTTGPWQGPLHEPFGDLPVDNILGGQLETDWDGNFVVWISPDRHPGNWIPSTAGIRKIFYRQYFDHWDEVPATFRIQRVGDGEVDPPPAIEPAALVESFQKAGEFVVNCTKDWPDTLFERDGIYGHVNEFVRAGEEKNDAADAKRGRVVDTLHWNIELDEALILEFEAKPDWFWQATACSVFGASLDFRHRQVNLTSGMSPVDADGTTRLVLGHTDPGFANWIDLQDHTRGWFLFRVMLTRETPEWRLKLVKADDLDRELGDIATRITPEERVTALRRRRDAIMRRYET